MIINIKKIIFVIFLLCLNIHFCSFCYANNNYTITKSYSCAKTGKTFNEIKQKNKFGILNEKGKIIVPIIFDKTDEIAIFNKTEFFLCTKEGKSSLYSVNGEEIIPLKLKSFIQRFSNYFIIQNVNNKYSVWYFNYVSGKSSPILENEDYIDSYLISGIDKKIYIIAKRNNKFGLLSYFPDKVLDVAIPFEYEDVFGTNHTKYCFVKKDNKWLVADMTNGNIQKRFKYDNLNKNRLTYRNLHAFEVTKKDKIVIHDLWENKCYTKKQYERKLYFEKIYNNIPYIGFLLIIYYKVENIFSR